MGYYRDEHKYDDIINMPYHKSTERAHMSLHDRAAQFAPFAAISGHEDAIDETARLTEEKITLDEAMIAKINEKLQKIVAADASQKKVVSITYFKEDSLKSGGAYLTDIGIIKNVDIVGQVVVMDSGVKINMDQIIDINSED